MWEVLILIAPVAIVPLLLSWLIIVIQLWKDKREQKHEEEVVSDEVVKLLNKLLKCNNCNKLFRNYQTIMMIVKEDLIYEQYIKENGTFPRPCPHCKKRDDASIVEKEYKWMRTDGDCPIADKETVAKVKDLVNHAIETAIERDEINSFMEYHELSPQDMSWVENLTRDNKNK